MGYKISAVILGAGKSTRMGEGINKIFLCLKQKPIICYSLAIFQKCHLINDITLVVREEDIKRAEDLVLNFGFSKVKKIISGGEERQDSVYNGLLALDNPEFVVIHDGARPFISEDLLTNSIDAAISFGAAVVAVPVKDTIKIVDNDGFIERTLERNKLYHIQTPQSFKYDLILKAYEKGIGEGLKVTDDAAFLESFGIKVRVVYGSYNNIKITTPFDRDLAEFLVEKIKY